MSPLTAFYVTRILALTADKSVDTEPASSDAPSPYGWDWSATTHDAKGSDRTVAGVVSDVLLALGAQNVLPGKGLQGWSESLQAFDLDGYRLGTVYFGGDRTDVHVLSTSAVADKSREAAVRVFSDYVRVPAPIPVKTARVDTRVDTMVPFEDVAKLMFEAARTYGSALRRVESIDPATGETCGRTLYLGSPSSAIQVRLYEKWLESPGQYPEGTNRVEVQLRPSSRKKVEVSGWSRAQTFGASKVTRDLAKRLGAELAPKNSLHVRRGTPDLERTLEVMAQQYGPSVDRFLSVGGSIDTVLERLLRLDGTLHLSDV